MPPCVEEKAGLAGRRKLQSEGDTVDSPVRKGGTKITTPSSEKPASSNATAKKRKAREKLAARAARNLDKMLTESPKGSAIPTPLKSASTKARKG